MTSDEHLREIVVHCRRILEYAPNTPLPPSERRLLAGLLGEALEGAADVPAPAHLVD